MPISSLHINGGKKHYWPSWGPPNWQSGVPMTTLCYIHILIACVGTEVSLMEGSYCKAQKLTDREVLKRKRK